MRIRVIIDRFEGEKAVLLIGEDERVVNWPRCFLPVASEGDILDIEMTVNEEATRQAKADADALLKQVVESNKDR